MFNIKFIVGKYLAPFFEKNCHFLVLLLCSSNSSVYTTKRPLMDLLSISTFSFTSAAEDVTVCFGLKSSVLIACTAFNSFFFK